MKQIIIGNTPSKSNNYRIIKKNGHGSLAKSSQIKEYEKSFDLQCNYYRNKNIEGLFEIKLNVFFPSNKSDLDNCLKCILDCLQTCKAIKNDNLCIKITAEKFIDKINPRIEFELIEI